MPRSGVTKSEIDLAAQNRAASLFMPLNLCGRQARGRHDPEMHVPLSPDGPRRDTRRSPSGHAADRLGEEEP